jgi:hypothetical protein
VKYAVAMDTVMIECGSMKSNQAFCSTALPAAPEPSDATRDCTMPASWVTRIIAKSHPAAVPVDFRPTPRQRKSGRKLRPARRQKNGRKAA